MKFICDESIDAFIADRLQDNGHKVTRVWEMEPGISDEFVIDLANKSSSILVTADKDFGELVFRLSRVHNGVLLVRLAGFSPLKKCDIISSAVANHGKEMKGSFTVITPGIVRIRR